MYLVKRDKHFVPNLKFQVKRFFLPVVCIKREITDREPSILLYKMYLILIDETKKISLFACNVGIEILNYLIKICDQNSKCWLSPLGSLVGHKIKIDKLVKFKWHWQFSISVFQVIQYSSMHTIKWNRFLLFDDDW